MGVSDTHFLTDERTFWHTTGVQALFMPVEGWVEPPAGSYGADTPGSKRRILNLVRASGLDQHLIIRSAPEATREQLLAIHPESYIDEFKKTSDAGGGELGMFAPFNKGGYEIACLSAGLAVEAVDTVMRGDAKNSYALCRPAGHHCLAEQSMGFCLLANIPIAIEAAKTKYGVSRVAVVDWDVHHGNGTQSIFYDRSDVLTISLHQDRCFPPGYSGLDERGEADGAGYNLNIPLPAGCGHESYLYAMHKIVLPALHAYQPELIIVASGLDANSVDPLARQLLHSDSFRAMTSLMMEAAEELCSARLAVIHEGGYAEAYTPFCGQAILEMLCGTQKIDDPELEFFSLQQPGERAEAFHRQWIDDIASEVSGKGEAGLSS
jgi:acetoin utilization deacetylase AcuC-like enzyme